MIFLPLVSHAPPQMHGAQIVHVIYVNGADQGHDALVDGFNWWHAISGATFAIYESSADIPGADLALDVCQDRSWLPEDRDPITLYVLPDWLHCGDTWMAGYALPGVAILSGPLRSEEAAHEIGHVYGAADEIVPGIMNFRTIRQSYIDGVISEQTKKAVGL